MIGVKFFFLESEDGNTLKFNVVKKTAFFDGEKKIKLDDLKIGDPVTARYRRFTDRLVPYFTRTKS